MKYFEQFKSVGIYALSNALIAFSALVFTVGLGRILGSASYGELATFIAYQNIWAALAFLRFETRIATSKTTYGAYRVALSGFLIGAIVSILFSMIAGVLIDFKNNFYLVFLSGFALQIFDVVAFLNAYEGRRGEVILSRAFRVVLPVLFAVTAASIFTDIQAVIRWYVGSTIIAALLYWRRWIGIKRWFVLTASSMQRYTKSLVPSLLFCFLNGVFLNGLTPALNAVVSASMAGQFAMLQRVLGGSLGVVNTAVSTHFCRKDFVDAKWVIVKKILFASLSVSIVIAIFFSWPILYGSSILLGAMWNFEPDFYISMSLFLICSYCVGAISIVAARLRDEWFLTVWQAAVLSMWLGAFWLIPYDTVINTVLLLGAAMYIALVIRWYFLMQHSKRVVY